MKRNGAFTIIEVLFVIGIFILMVIMLMPFVNMINERAHKIKCANHLRSISLGLHMYAADNNEAFPPTLGALYPDYVKEKKAFDCPSSASSGTPEKPGYSYTQGLTESSPSNEIIAQDFDDNHKKTGKNILRLNGLVEWIGARR